VGRHIDVNDSSPVVPQHDEDEQDAAGERRDRKEVNRYQCGDMIR
jgi:hypothetical protein